MKVEMVGRVLERFSRHAKNGRDYYSIVVEEPGLYPRPFEFSTENASLIGPDDGFARVGRVVRVTAFLNGYEKKFTGKDGTPGRMFTVTLRLHTLQPGGAKEQPEAGLVEPKAEDVKPSQDVTYDADGVASDMLF